MTISTISAGIDTGFSTKLNNNFSQLRQRLVTATSAGSVLGTKSLAVSTFGAVAGDVILDVYVTASIQSKITDETPTGLFGLYFYMDGASLGDFTVTATGMSIVDNEWYALSQPIVWSTIGTTIAANNSAIVMNVAGSTTNFDYLKNVVVKILYAKDVVNSSSVTF